MSFTPSGYERFSTLSPQQSDIFNQISSMLQGQLGGEGQEKFEAPYKREFQEKTIPGLAERFSGLGSGAQSSSGFRQALGASGADLSERLASLGGQQQQNSMSQLMQLLGINTEGLVPEAKPWWQELLTSLSGGLSAGVGSIAGGAGGNALMSLLSNLGRKQQGSTIGQSGQITGKFY